MKHKWGVGGLPPCLSDVVTIEKENNPQNIPHKEVFRGCTIIGIFFDSCLATRYKQIDMKSCLSVASSLNDSDNRTSGL